MNRNDNKKSKNAKKGLVDPSSIQEYEVHKKTTLMEFLFFVRPDLPRKTIKSLLSHHQVAVGGVPVSQFDYPLVEEDSVIISKRNKEKKETRDLPIIYEDEYIIAINKPSGLLSVATDREKGKTAYRLVSDYVRARNQKARVYVVHRLDEDTSGVLIFGKTPEVRDSFQSSWQDIVQNRFYYAIVEGEINPPSASLEDYLADNDLHLVYVTKNRAKGKLARTDYTLIKYKKPYSLLDVHIFSGRKNQIRVQLGSRGFYVVGDDKYGEPTNPLNRLGLHAYRLTLVNPLNKKVYDFTAPMPEDFKKLMFSKTGDSAKNVNKVAEKKQKAMRDTRTATKIKKGKTGFKAYKKGVTKGNKKR